MKQLTEYVVLTGSGTVIEVRADHYTRDKEHTTFYVVSKLDKKDKPTQWAPIFTTSNTSSFWEKGNGHVFSTEGEIL